MTTDYADTEVKDERDYVFVYLMPSKGSVKEKKDARAGVWRLMESGDYKNLRSGVYYKQVDDADAELERLGGSVPAGAEIIAMGVISDQVDGWMHARGVATEEEAEAHDDSDEVEGDEPTPDADGNFTAQAPDEAPDTEAAEPDEEDKAAEDARFDAPVDTSDEEDEEDEEAGSGEEQGL